MYQPSGPVLGQAGPTSNARINSTALPESARQPATSALNEVPQLPQLPQMPQTPQKSGQQNDAMELVDFSRQPVRFAPNEMTQMPQMQQTIARDSVAGPAGTVGDGETAELPQNGDVPISPLNVCVLGQLCCANPKPNTALYLFPFTFYDIQIRINLGNVLDVRLPDITVAMLLERLIPSNRANDRKRVVRQVTAYRQVTFGILVEVELQGIFLNKTMRQSIVDDTSGGLKLAFYDTSTGLNIPEGHPVPWPGLPNRINGLPNRRTG